MLDNSRFQFYDQLLAKIQENSVLIDVKMASLFKAQKEKCFGDHLFEAIEYSALSQGKKLRGFLVLKTAQMFGVSLESALTIASALEFLHASSLVHDDLPAMDDALLRRGKKSCHLAYDEATAILVGDALLIYPFEILSASELDLRSDQKLKLIHMLSQASGLKGMILGQMKDLLAEKTKIDYEEIKRIQAFKTGKLFEFSCLAAAYISGASQAQIEALLHYAQCIGICFQITDDILDVEGEESAVGKSTQIDAQHQKQNFVQALGLVKAKELAKELAAEAKKSLDLFDKSDAIEALSQLADYILVRQK